MSLPFFDTLQQCFPHSPVDLIAKESIQEVFRHHPAIRTIHPFSKARVNGLPGLLAYGQSLRPFGPYDLFITLTPSFSSAVIGYGVGSPVRVGYRAEGRSLLLTHAVAEESGILRAHAYRHLLTHLEAQVTRPRFPKLFGRRYSQPIVFEAPVPPDSAVQQIRFPFSDQERTTPFLHKQPQFTYVVLNVNAEAQSRRLPLEKWIEFGKRLLAESERQFMLVFMGTPSEQPRVAEVIRGIGSPERMLDFSGKTTVRELAMLLRDADAVVTNDSGPMHLANAVGAPMVTFIGAADPVETEPFNAPKTVVINKHVACSPCVKNICRLASVQCLELITVEEMYQSLFQVLSPR